MGFYISDIKLVDFRNFLYKEVDLSPTTSIFLGPNAAGKTNMAEALRLLTVPESLRATLPAVQIRNNKNSACVWGKLCGDERELEHECKIVEHGRIYSINGKVCKARNFTDNLSSVFFSPDDLLIVKGAAKLRREEIDGFASRISGEYAHILKIYQKTLEQKNKLLKDQYPNYSLLDVWDEHLARAGAVLLLSRTRMFLELKKIISECYTYISGGENLVCNYVFSAESVGGLAEDPTEKEKLKNILLASFLHSRQKDISLGYTSTGPHRDDIDFCIFGKSVKTFASQGQQRSIILALKIAETIFIKQHLGVYPLLLLDDVMSELDKKRREAVLEFISRGIQTIITTTTKEYFSSEFLSSVKVIRFEH